MWVCFWMNTLRVSKLEVSWEDRQGRFQKLWRGFPYKAFARGETSNLPLEGQRVFQRLHPREPSLEDFRNMAWRPVGGFLFWFLTSRVGDEHTLRVPTARDWRSRSRFQVFPSETSRVSETPLFELLNEEDSWLLQNHDDESSVVGSLYVSAGATVAGLSWTLLVPSTFVSALG